MARRITPLTPKGGRVDSLRLRLLLTFAVHNAGLSSALTHQVFLMALQQWYQGTTFVGRVVHYDTAAAHLLLLGMQ